MIKRLRLWDCMKLPEYFSVASHVARDRSRELSVSRSACAFRLCLSCQKTKHIEESKNFWATLLLYSGVEEDLPNVLRPRLPLWGSEVGFGAWSSEKGLWGTGKVKSSDNGEQCEEKESNHVESHSPFWSFSYPEPSFRVSGSIRAVGPPVSLFALSLVLRIPDFCTYVSLSICCSLSLFLFHDVFSWRKAPAAQTRILLICEPTRQVSAEPSAMMHPIFVILISPVSMI